MSGRTLQELQEEVQRLQSALRQTDVYATIKQQPGAEELCNQFAAALCRLVAQQAPRVEDRQKLEEQLEDARQRWQETEGNAVRMVRRVMIYQVGWLIVLAAGGLTFTFAAPFGPVPHAWLVGGACLLWGAAGACFSSITALITHHAQRTLDPAYAPWHYAKPLMGAFTGGLIFLLLQAGINLVTDTPGLTAPLMGADKALLAYALAALCGFQEEAFINKVRQLLKVLLGVGSDPPPTQVSPTPSLPYQQLPAQPFDPGQL